MKRISLSILYVTLATGCASFQPAPVNTPVQWPAQWMGDSGTTRELSDRWWQGYQDPQLDRWIDLALANNPGLAATAESVIQADLLLENVGADLLPSLRASGSTGRQRSETAAGQSSQRDSTSLGLSLDYELDLWGRLAAARSGALLERDATRFDYDNARLSLAAATATTWFEWLALQDRLDVAQSNLDIAERTLALVSARYRNGAADRSELARQETRVLSLRNAVPPLEYQSEQRLAALTVLTGALPYQSDAPEGELRSVEIPSANPGAPADLVLRRPDLAAQEARLMGAEANIEQARASLLPSVSLSAAVSLASGGLFSLNDPTTGTSGLVSLGQTLFDGGQRRNAVALSESQRLALLESYRGSLLTAFQEVGDALAREDLYRGEEARLADILDRAEETLRLTEVRYREGAADLLTLLDAQTGVFQVREQISQNRLNRLLASVDLHQALGGGWEKPDQAVSSQGPGSAGG